VVPTTVAVGWELALADSVVVVHEVRPTVIVVHHHDGRAEEIQVIREDNADNGQDLE